MTKSRAMGKRTGGRLPWLALCWALASGTGLAQEPSSAGPGLRAIRPSPPGGPVVVRSAFRAEQGCYPRVLVQTVPDSQVSATVLAIRYRRPGEEGSAGASAAHLLEHLLFRSRAGSPPGAMLVRAESFGGQSLAYLTSGVIVLGEVVPSEQGLESLSLQLERLRAVPSDAADLSLEKQSVSREILSLGAAPEETARRELLARLGVNARVEGDVETLAALGTPDLERLLDGLVLEKDIVIAVVGPHSEREVRQHLSQKLTALRPAGTEARPKLALPPVANSRLEVASALGYSQESFFLSLPDLSTAELMLAEELLREAVGGRVWLSLSKEDQGLYRLDVSPPSSAAELAGRLRGSSFDGTALAARLQRSWLDRYELPLDRAEMLALEALDRGSFSAPPAPAELADWRENLLGLLEPALLKAPSLLLTAEGEAVEGLYGFKETAKASPAELHRQTLSNGLTVAWQEQRSWPVVATSGFFRLRRTLTPDECAQLESKLEARSAARLDYEVRPDALFFHFWCPASELTSSLAASAAEIRALSESAEVLVERGSSAGAGAMEEFFLGGLPLPQPNAVSGRTLIYPEGGQLVIVGDIEPLALEHGLRPAWNGWFAEKPPRAIAPVTSAPVEGPPSRTVAMPATESPLLLVGVWGPNRSAPDFLAFNLALQTLAGRPTTSLLARQLRDGDGLVETVSVFPMTGSDRSDGRQLWLIALRPRQANADATALAARVEGRLSELGREVLPETELARTRNYLKAALKISTSTPRGRARVLANSEFYRLSEQYSTDYAGLYDRIDSSQVRTVCQKYLAEQTARWLYFQPR